MSSETGWVPRWPRSLTFSRSAAGSASWPPARSSTASVTAGCSCWRCWSRGATALAAVLLVPRSQVRTDRRLPRGPASLLTSWLAALLVAISQGAQWGCISPGSLALYAVAVLGALAWARAEVVAPVPLIDMFMMRRRGVWTAHVVGAAVGFSMFASFGFLPPLLQTRQRPATDSAPRSPISGS